MVQASEKHTEMGSGTVSATLPFRAAIKSIGRITIIYVKTDLNGEGNFPRLSDFSVGYASVNAHKLAGIRIPC